MTILTCLSQKQQFKKTISIASYCFYADVISKYNNYPRTMYDPLVRHSECIWI